MICHLEPQRLTQKIVRLKVHKEFQTLLFLKQGELEIQGRKSKSREQGYAKHRQSGASIGSPETHVKPGIGRDSFLIKKQSRPRYKVS